MAEEVVVAAVPILVSMRLARSPQAYRDGSRTSATAGRPMNRWCCLDRSGCRQVQDLARPDLTAAQVIGGLDVRYRLLDIRPRVVRLGNAPEGLTGLDDSARTRVR